MGFAPKPETERNVATQKAWAWQDECIRFFSHEHKQIVFAM